MMLFGPGQSITANASHLRAIFAKILSINWLAAFSVLYTFEPRGCFWTAVP